MWNLDIPKTVFFYWGGPSFSFLRYMSIYSFKKMNPDWTIKLYCPLVPVKKTIWSGKQFESKTKIKNYIKNVSEDLLIRPNIFDFEQLGLDNNMNEVHKSDFIRYHLLNKFGGVWADTDILFIKPMDELLCNKQKTKGSAYFYYGKNTDEKKEIDGHGIGFLMGQKGNSFYSDVFKCVKENFNGIDYQSAGADTLNKNFSLNIIKEKYPSAVCLDTDSVYSINHNYKNFLYNSYNENMLSENSIGIHWYGGSEYVKKILLEVNDENFKNYKNEGALIKTLKEKFSEDF